MIMCMKALTEVFSKVLKSQRKLYILTYISAVTQVDKGIDEFYKNLIYDTH